MKSIWLHGVYLSIIGVLAFQLWSKAAATEGAFAELEDIIGRDCKALKSDNEYTFYDINRHFRGNSRFEIYIENAQKVRNISRLALDIVTKGFSDLSIYKKLDTKTLRDSLRNYPNRVLSILGSHDSAYLLNNSQVYKFIKDPLLWNKFSSNPKTLLYLIQNKILLDEQMCLFATRDRVSICVDIKHYGLKLGIYPQKGSLVDGETFEADLMLVPFAQNTDNIAEIIVDGQPVNIKEGIAHFSKKEMGIGLKKIHAVATVKNPATGEVTIFDSAFEYHVLPKCSENCQ